MTADTASRRTNDRRPKRGCIGADRDHVTHPGKRSHRVLLGGALALAAVLPACGSSDSDSSKEPPTAEATDGSTKDANGGPGDSVAAPKGRGGTGTGQIEIGDISHDLKIDNCVTMSGAISGRATSVSEPDNVDVNFSFSPENWSDRDDAADWGENGTVRLDRDDPYEQWESGASIFEGFNLPAGVQATDFTVTSYDVSDDGQSVTGEARFVEVNALLGGKASEPTAGSFAFSCPPKG